jgi:hypothetical protein
MLIVANRLLSSKAHHRVARLGIGIPRSGAVRTLENNDLV